MQIRIFMVLNVFTEFKITETKTLPSVCCVQILIDAVV